MHANCFCLKVVAHRVRNIHALFRIRDSVALNCQKPFKMLATDVKNT